MDRTLRFAIAGVGNIGSLHARAIAEIEEASLTAVFSRSEKRAREVATAHGVDWTTDWRALVERDDVDVVSVCTPSGAHMEIAVAAARAGKHVIVEKPIEVSLERADAVIEACRKGGVKLACIFPARLKPGAEKLKKAVTEGRLGRLTLCDVQVKWHRSQEYYDAGGWRGTWEWDGGGALMNQGIHHVDLLQYIAGPVRSVFAQCATLAHTMETEDTVAASLSFESGALGVIEATTGAWPGLAGRLEISGDRGTVTLEDVAVVRWDLADATEAEKTGVLAERGPEGSGRADPMGIAHHGHLLQIRDLVLAVQEDRTPRIDGYEGRKAVEIVRAVYHSARTGRPVDLPFDE